MSNDIPTDEVQETAQVAISQTRVYRELNLKASELADRVAHCAGSVRRDLGPGWPKAIYEEAMAVEFARNGIEFERNKAVEVVFREKAIGMHSFAFVVEGAIAVEMTPRGEAGEVQAAEFRCRISVCGIHSGLLIDIHGNPVGIRHVGGESAIPAGEVPDLPETSVEFIDAARPNGGFGNGVFEGLEQGNGTGHAITDGNGRGGVAEAAVKKPSARGAWLGLLLLFVTACVAAAKYLPTDAQCRTLRSEVASQFCRQGYFDREACRSFAETVIPERNPGEAKRVAAATNTILAALSAADLDAVNSDFVSDALAAIDSCESKQRLGAIVMLADTARHVRRLTDASRFLGDASFPSELQVRLAEWKSRITALQQDRLLSSEPAKLLHLVYALTSRADTQVKARIAIPECARRTAVVLAACSLNIAGRCHALLPLARGTANPEDSGKDRELRKTEIFSVRSAAL